MLAIEAESLVREWFPHGYCLAWDYRLIAVEVISDGFIFLAYVILALGLLLAHRMGALDRLIRKDNVWMWICFIFACGNTHFLSTFAVWLPIYIATAGFKVITAAVSVAAAADAVAKLLEIRKERLSAHA